MDVETDYCRTSRDTLLTKEVTVLLCMGAASPHILGAVLGTRT